MKLTRYSIPILAVLAVFLASCANTPPMVMEEKAPEKEMQPGEMPAKGGEMPAKGMDKPTQAGAGMEKEMPKAQDDMMKETDMPKAQDAMMEETDIPKAQDAMLKTPAWFNSTLTAVNTGQDFTIADFHGKVVLLETMAMWCPNCKKQQQQVASLHQMLGEKEDFVTVALDVDSKEDAAQLKKYAQDNKFNWIYAVAPLDVAQEIANLYGEQFLNPSATPMLVIDKTGTAHVLEFGVKGAAELKDALQPFLEG